MNSAELVEFFGDTISVYTRARAIEDEVLIDITNHAKKFGYQCPVAITDIAMKASLQNCSQVEANIDSIFKVTCLINILKTLKEAILNNSSNCNIIIFEVMVFTPILKTEANMQFKCHLGGGDDGELVITIMLPDED